MFDFGAIGNVVETLQNGIRDIDSRLESIETMTRLQTVIAIRTRLDQLNIIEFGTADHGDENAWGEERTELLVALANMQREPVVIEHSGKLPDVDWSDERG